MPEPADFIRAMRHFPAAVNLITTGDRNDRVGFTATAVMSLTAEPPQVLVAVNRTVSAYPFILRNGAFCVNTLAAHDSELARRFAGAVTNAERFSTGQWTRLQTGSPALDNAILNLDCAVVGQIPFETHELIVGRVQAMRFDPSLKPLLFVEGKWASLIPGATVEEQPIMGAIEESIQVINKARIVGGNPSEQLSTLVKELTQVYIGRQAETRDYLSAEIYAPPERLSDLNAARRMFDDQLVDLLQRGQQEGRFEIDDPKLTAFAIAGLVGWVHRWFQPNGRLSPAEIGEHLTRLVNRMVAAEGAEPQKTAVL